MNLSDRLIKIAGFIKKNTVVLDVGTDHGYIPIYLIENQISKKIIASDISPDSLNKTIELVKKKGLEKNIDSRLGDGLDVVNPFEVEGVIMAGMGGILIQNILEKNKEVTNSIDYFIFQPMIASKELRQYLSRNKFKIIDEELSKEGDKFYEILYVEKGFENPKEEIYYEISERLIEKKHPLLKEFIENKIKLINSVMEELKDKTNKRSIERYNELKIKTKQYMEVLNQVET
ncbi:tRNA (adenine(22)-N(1))-methyltransferase [Tissierella creatinophila]|uniref:tRNA (Adenine(22)-N(1))-methyltransferase n=1 Tax=Tissierella creatinophila DSM 6911 TaxID=1123403 RepID=A0A1U7M7Y0_TISCR|nr:class I SAM-dependent methyltransferase [Tissierella creatinophila]OLS03360.1 tRNA (adenine(22)-N(1))-methyltransferase [Tissierella creatinophila DSM 6911]